ncbi:MAG: ATP-binding protein [Thermodesulfobacteriota bacterium]|nr:ATP-binding protein [Thermodesulfobacteriota bacterium]
MGTSLNVRLKKLIEANQILARMESLDELLPQLLRLAQDVTGAEASSILLYNPDREVLDFALVMNDVIGEERVRILEQKMELPLGEGIAGWVALHKKPLNVKDAQKDTRFSKKADKETGFVTRCLVCVPVMHGQTLLGVVQALNPKKRKWFDEDDQELLESFGHLAAVAIVRSRLLRERLKQREIEARLESQLRQAQKMEALGTLAGGIAHDFNNILGVIMGYTEMGLEDVAPGGPMERRLKEILGAGRRARDLIHQILTFSRQEEREFRPLHLGPVVGEIAKLLRASLPANIRIRQNLSADPDLVLADSTQIHQVLMNLCANAAFAMRETGGTLTISLKETGLDEAGPDAGVPVNIGRRGFVRLSVRDTGPGIEPMILDSIFDPFFTTKQQGQGTGMGLAMVHGIVHGFGGTVSVDSKPGRGASFHVFLPKAGKKPRVHRDIEVPAPRGQGRVLFVDDEKALVDIGREVLTGLGFKVSAKTSAKKALEVFRGDPNGFDLVITDQTMPELTGAELAQEILAVRPDMPIILCTGFSETVSPERAKALGVRDFLLKPVLKKDMAESIRRVLSLDLDEGK